MRKAELSPWSPRSIAWIGVGAGIIAILVSALFAVSGDLLDAAVSGIGGAIALLTSVVKLRTMER